MIPDIVLDNVLSWVLQVTVLAFAGAVLPMVFRIRHPRSLLLYCHVLIVVCVVLPLVQPWQHPIVFFGSAVTSSSVIPATQGMIATADRPFDWRYILAWILFAGFSARLCWTAVGLWMIRRHQAEATPIYPVPDSIKDAATLAKANATFCMSGKGVGPVTMGIFRPVVLVPASFMSLDSDAQRAIACHELAHVRRKDWLVTLFEEIAGALFWFHPGFWWILGQARLAREQLVDAEVVRLTSARQPYIDALLTMAGVRPRLDLAPAPLFLRRRHLLQRMQLLVTEVRMSQVRLVSSYLSMMAVLAAVGWLCFASFPLTGSAEMREVVAPIQPPPQQNSPGYVVNVPARSYPAEAAAKKIEGTVAVELTFNAAGNIVDMHVLSGPEELREAALDTALRSGVTPSVARTLQVLVEFQLANLPVPPPPPPPPPPSPRSGGAIVERFEIQGLPEAQAAEVSQKLRDLEGQFLLYSRIGRELGAAARSAGVELSINFTIFRARENRIVVQAFFGQSPIQTPFGVVAPGQGVATQFGVVGGPAPRVEVAAGNGPEPLSEVLPAYPPLAAQARVQGVVALEVQIGTKGSVDNIRVVTGHPLLIQASIDAVKAWVYPPQASPVTTTVQLNFHF